MGPEPSSMDEWKELQTQLVAKERRLADLALLHARGEASEAQLDTERRALDLLRDMAKVAFDRMLFELQVDD
jgi:hypothetical protein